MTALARHQGLTLDEAIERTVDRANAGEPVAETAREIALLLDPEARVDAAAKGLAMFAHQRLAIMRNPREDEAEGGPESDKRTGFAPPVRAAHYTKELWERRLAANYEAADGTRKALLDFTRLDVANLQSLAVARANGYLHLSDAMQVAERLLAHHKRDAIRLLPKAAQREIAEALA